MGAGDLDKSLGQGHVDSVDGGHVGHVSDLGDESDHAGEDTAKPSLEFRYSSCRLFL